MASTERPRSSEGPARADRSSSVVAASGVESLRRLNEHEAIDLVGVVTAPPRPAGRSRSSPIGHCGIERDDPDARAPARPGIAREHPGAPARAAGPRRLRPDRPGRTARSLKHGALNLHPSLLPRHRGATPIPAAILAGDRETGVTLMRMDRGLDTGPIVAVERVPLDGTEIAPQLEADLELVAADLLDTKPGPMDPGRAGAAPAIERGRGLSREPLRREDGRIDPRRSAVELERQVRAYQPWPGLVRGYAVGTGSSSGRREPRGPAGRRAAPSTIAASASAMVSAWASSRCSPRAASA